MKVVVITDGEPFVVEAASEVYLMEAGDLTMRRDPKTGDVLIVPRIERRDE